MKLSNITIVSLIWISVLFTLPIFGQTRTVYSNEHSKKDALPQKVDTLKEQKLKEVTVKATRLLFVTKGDTTLYDLDALTLKNGALLKEAFEKLPGISFLNGSLYHNGQEIKRVLINGVDFSSKNPLLALQTLPSYIMKNIKVYERKSDFSEKTGIDDGQQELVADVSVRRKYMGVWTGQLTVGVGTDKRFSGKGFGNTFTDQFRVSLFGNANNVNEQMWYSGDGQERAGAAQPGDNQFYTPGATFLWKNKKTSKEKGYFLISGGLDYNKEIYDKEELYRTELYLSDGSLFSAGKTISTTNRNRFSNNLKMDWNISNSLSASYVASLELNRSRDNHNVDKANWNEAPIVEDGGIANALTILQNSNGQEQTAIDFQQRKNDFNQNNSAYQHQLSFNYDFLKSGTYLTVKHRLNLNNDAQEEQQNTYYKYFNQEAHKSYGFDRKLDTETNKNTQDIFARIIHFFTVKGFSRFALSLDYRYNQSNIEYGRDGFLANLKMRQDSPLSRAIDDESTRSWNEKDYQHTIEPKLSIAKSIFAFEFTPTLNFKRQQLDYHKRNLPDLSLKQEYRYWAIEALFRVRSSPVGSLLARFHSTPNIPSIHSFVSYPDKTDPQYIVMGNENLTMGRSNTLLAWYWRNFVQDGEKGKLTRTLSAHLLYSRQQNDVANFTTYNRKTGVVTIQPVNVSGNWNGKVNIGFTSPLDLAQHFWLETEVEASILRTKTFSGTESLGNIVPQINDNRFLSYKASIKPRLKIGTTDFTMSYDLILEDNHSTYFSADNKKQWQHLIGGKLNTLLPFDINVEANCRYHNYSGYLTNKREHWVMLDFEFGKSLLKKKNLFVGLSIHDFLNQNNGFFQQYNATDFTQSHHRMLGRYGMLTLKYSFSSQKK